MFKKKSTLRKRTQALLTVSKTTKKLSPRVRKDAAMSLKANRKIFDKGAGSPKTARKLKKSLTREHLKTGAFLKSPTDKFHKIFY